MSKKPIKQLPAYAVIILDILAIGASLCIFALFHHVIPVAIDEEPQQISSAVLPTYAPATPKPTVMPSASTTATPEPTIEPTPIPVGDFSLTFPDYDTGLMADHSYQSDNVRIAITTEKAGKATYYVADIWIRYISCLRTAFAENTYGRSFDDSLLNMAEQNNAILATNGDYYGAREQGVVIRNGLLYRDSAYTDVCVINIDGTMKTYKKNEFSIDDVTANGAYHAWNFGPRLLLDGEAISEFKSSVRSENPRCAIGYYEPGHYCLIVVDGRQSGYSSGMTLEELSTLFYNLGCVEAYNLDGGQTAMMEFQGEIVNQPFRGGRYCSDIVYIGEAE